MDEQTRIFFVQEELRTDEQGRIVLTAEMKNSLHNAEQSLAKGRCFNNERFHERFAKWL